ncbi:MAG: hypothetical protein HN731_14315 [Rhodospirillaceae bacterium]|jgi:hypothetical protein|nr:hypothetical protein [Rhodospirillaceae bacterium]MBT7956361.1 hypothetical protein [Rhodospirillaceae bacterium]
MNSSDLQKLSEATGISGEEIAALDAKIEEAVITEVDIFSLRAERDAILIRFLADDDFALYEPELFEQFKLASVHAVFIERAKHAIERLGGEVTIAYMESGHYETWLGVNDFDDNRELRIAWARQQIRGLSN